MNIPLNLDTTLLEQSFQKIDKESLSDEQKLLFQSLIQNKNISNINSSEMNLAKALLTSNDYSNDNIFNKALFAAIEDGDIDSLKTLSAISSLRVTRELTGFSNKNKEDLYFNSRDSFSNLYHHNTQKEMIKELEEKVKTIKENISKTDDEKIKSAYEEEYKIFSKVLEKYKEFQEEDEKILTQMIRSYKQNPLI